VFCAALVLCPAMLATGRQVNNDALGVLGGCLAYAAVARRLADGGGGGGGLGGGGGGGRGGGGGGGWRCGRSRRRGWRWGFS
jgi:hypothetical protein